MKIITTQVLRDIDGTEFKDIALGKVLARILSGTKNNDPLRAYVLSQDFFSKEEIDLNDADMKFITETVKANGLQEGGYAPIITGQILSLLK